MIQPDGGARFQSQMIRAIGGKYVNDPLCGNLLVIAFPPNDVNLLTAYGPVLEFVVEGAGNGLVRAFRFRHHSAHISSTKTQEGLPAPRCQSGSDPYVTARIRT